LAAELPSNGRALEVRPAISTDDFLVGKLDRRVKATVVNDRREQYILIAIGVALREKGLCNQIGGQFHLVSIVKFDDIRTSVEDGVLMSTPSRVAIPITFTAEYTATGHSTATGKHYLSGDKVITGFRGDFGITDVRVKDVIIVVMTWVRCNVLRWEVFNSSSGAEVCRNGSIEVLAHR